MALPFTKIPTKTFEQLQLNAGVLLSSFTPAKKPTINASDILCATTGGISFSDEVQYIDFGDDIDNCPANMKELKREDGHVVKLSGTAISLSDSFVSKLIGSVDKDTQTEGFAKFTPLNELTEDAFSDIWWVGDYGNGGWVAIHIMDALNDGGFKFQSNDNGKGNSAFEFTGHYSIENQDVVPYEFFMSVSA